MTTIDPERCSMRDDVRRWWGLLSIDARRWFENWYAENPPPPSFHGMVCDYIYEAAPRLHTDIPPKRHLWWEYG